MLRHGVGELFVDLEVGVPVADLERNLIEQIMEERPEDAVGVPLVVPGHLRSGEWVPPPAASPTAFAPAPSLLLRQILFRAAGPADPDPAGLLVRPEQSGSQTSRALLDLHPGFGGADRHRQPVGDDDDPRHYRGQT